MFILVLGLKEMERLENQPCEWDDHLLAQALESEQRREQEEQKLQEDEKLKKLQVLTNDIDLIKCSQPPIFFIEKYSDPKVRVLD